MAKEILKLDAQESEGTTLTVEADAESCNVEIRTDYDDRGEFVANPVSMTLNKTEALKLAAALLVWAAG